MRVRVKYSAILAHFRARERKPRHTLAGCHGSSDKDGVIEEAGGGVSKEDGLLLIAGSPTIEPREWVRRPTIIQFQLSLITVIFSSGPKVFL